MKKSASTPEEFLEKDKPVLIKTYMFESGLFYLAKSLGDRLTELGYDVFYMPKERYVQDGVFFKRTYPPSRFDLGIDESRVLMLNADADLRSTTKHKVIKHKIGTIVSFETFTGDWDWISYIQKSGVKVIDVPMIEWVSRQAFEGSSYRLFDQVWCLNNLVYDKFSMQYKNTKEKIKRVNWDFSDKSIVNTDEKSNTFIHFGATNNGLDVKNTKETLKAFKQLSDMRQDVSFVYVGAQFPEQNGISNLTAYNDYLTRDQIISLYNKSSCVVAPSLREGLGMSILEGLAAGAKVITTDYAPMNERNDLILCKPNAIKQDGALTPLAITNSFSIFNAMLHFLSDKHV